MKKYLRATVFAAVLSGVAGFAFGSMAHAADECAAVICKSESLSSSERSRLADDIRQAQKEVDDIHKVNRSYEAVAESNPFPMDEDTSGLSDADLRAIDRAHDLGQTGARIDEVNTEASSRLVELLQTEKIESANAQIRQIEALAQEAQAANALLEK